MKRQGTQWRLNCEQSAGEEGQRAEKAAQRAGDGGRRADQTKAVSTLSSEQVRQDSYSRTGWATSRCWKNALVRQEIEQKRLYIKQKWQDGEHQRLESSEQVMQDR